jgi:hypothetical protein
LQSAAPDVKQFLVKQN